jgi:hypothetical protein
MSTATHFHYPVTVEALSAESATWLKLTDKHRNTVTVFMPLAQAEAMAIAFNAYVDEPEPDDEPRECDDSSYRRDMIDAGRGHLLR